MSNTVGNHTRRLCQGLFAVAAFALAAQWSSAASAAPDISVTKTCALNGPHSVLCTITVSNIGTSASISPMTLTDQVTGAPSNGQFTGGGGTLPISCSPGAGPILPISCHAAISLAPGQVKNALFSFNLPTGGSFTNCATVTTAINPTTPGDTHPANNTNICTSISVPTTSNAPDLSVTKTCAVNGPQSILCTVTVTNVGTAASVSPITLTDVVSGAPANGLYVGAGGTLPISCSPGAGPILPISCHAAVSLTPGQSKNALFAFKLPTGGSFTNCATATTPMTPAMPGDPNPGNNTNICASISIPSTASAPDLSVAKTCAVNGPHSVLCTITVTNIGTAPSLSPITLTDQVTGAPSNGLFTGGGGTLPISCSPGAGPILPISCHAATSLTPGQSKTALFSFKLPTGGSFTNCATATAATVLSSPGDPNPANNTHICASVMVAP